MVSRQVFVILLILAILALTAAFIWRVATHGPM